jgi:hypothetical protein|nr:MAG TPA: Hint [Bacteriophage sp.]
MAIPNKEIQEMFDLSAGIISAHEMREKEKTKEKTEVEKTVSMIQETESKSIPILFSSRGIKVVDNKITRARYLDALSLDDKLYESIVLTESEALAFSTSLRRSTDGGISTYSPMICRGQNCKVKETCLTGDSMVSMHDGKQVRIDRIKSGDKIISFNTKTKCIERDTVYATTYVGEELVYEITTTAGHCIKATSNHQFFAIKGRGSKFKFLSIDDGLTVGSKLVYEDLFSEEENSYGDCLITKIESIEAIGVLPVYDIQVFKNSNFFAEGLLVHNCQLYKMNKAPVGAPCIYEQDYLRSQTERYFEEFNVQPDSPTEMQMVAELAEIDLYERRVTQILSLTHQDFSQEDMMGFDAAGNMIARDDISRYLNIKEKLKNRRSKLLESLMATRKERAKIAVQASGSAIGSGSQSLKDKLDMLTAATRGQYVDPSVINGSKNDTNQKGSK